MKRILVNYGAPKHAKTQPLHHVAVNGQYNVHGRALTQVFTAVLAESFGQK